MRLRTYGFVSILLSMLTAMVVAARAEEPLRRTVSVSAQSQVQVAADEVVVSLEVTTNDKNLTAAKTDNDKRTQDILSLGKKYRLAENAVKIDSFTVRRQFDREGTTFLGYYVNREIEFVLRDFNDLDSLVSDALAAGATGLDGLLLRTTKHREQQWEARRIAVERAKEKAEHLAQLNGLALGMAIEIHEGVEGDDRSTPLCSVAPSTASNEHGKVKIHLVSALQEKDDAKSADAKPQTTSALGEITVRATVHVTFELKERSS